MGTFPTSKSLSIKLVGSSMLVYGGEGGLGVGERREELSCDTL